ncbi:hypothetical protein HELRODRAFT_188013 [Helobdella robusta]|uniref:Uncharacterized protein n=1 Tax=Helobdella robusta TaxID=6412 RepID=T1FPJ7_HELRO|nr:hypothetical protein HELRODRAFT_188013 [Helobdella robusta]ESO12857.1 hypothetical protein HELRODRAFT_188013 [Helobdella robusta]
MDGLFVPGSTHDVDISAYTYFGSTEPMEYLTKKKIYISQYLFTVVKYFVNRGFIKDQTIRGASYDFRKAPNELEEFNRKMTNLVEETYRMTFNKKVVLIGHSMGCLVLLHWLNGLNQEWKDKYISLFISLAAPWSGSLSALNVLMTGSFPEFKNFKLDLHEVRDLARTFPSLAWLMPNEVYWDKKDDPLVMSPTRNYTVRDYRELFRDINYETGYLMYENTKNLLKLENPGVDMLCVFGDGYSNKTIHSLDFRGRSPTKWFDEMPALITGDGDETVPAHSLKKCVSWQRTKIIRMKTTHLGLLAQEALLNLLVENITNLVTTVNTPASTTTTSTTTTTTTAAATTTTVTTAIATTPAEVIKSFQNSLAITTRSFLPLLNNDDEDDDKSSSSEMKLLSGLCFLLTVGSVWYLHELHQLFDMD